MKLTEVNDKRTARLFLDAARVIYKNDPNWICPMNQSIEKIFDPSQNVFFTHGEATRWILQDEAGHLIGRVAAFINGKKAYSFSCPTGGMGFFECVEDQGAANLLFNTCRDWLSARGMEAMDGPINFGENDQFWGLLVEGFMPPTYGMQYHPPYYRKFFEDYGFKPYFEQITNHLDLTKPFPERFWKIAEWAMSRPGLRFEHFTYENAEKYMADLKTVYDQAWQFQESFTPIETKVLRDSLEEAKLFLVPEFNWFVYHNDQPAAFLIMLPDINQALRHVGGKINLWNKIRLYYYIKIKGFTRARVTIMGVIPSCQRMGLESGIFWHLNEVVKKLPQYKELELSWVGDFNPKMRALHEAVGGYFAKKHITYRKLFADDADFHRSSIIPVDTKFNYKKGLA